MIEPLLWFSAGLVLLLLGADGFLKGASDLALRYGISPFVVGLTIVGFGTSAPELAVNLSAAWKGSYELALGNVVGSNIANVGLILGASALVAPLLVQMRLLRFEAPLVLAVSFLLWLLCLDGELGRADAALLMAGLAGLAVYIIQTARAESGAVQGELAAIAHDDPSLPRALARLLIGLTMLVYGAQCMVDAAIVLARLWGMSELLIGLTVVAIGTSLPELASSLLAASRGQTDVAVGNVIGSNLFNILFILGATGLLHPLPVAPSLLQVELPVMCGFALAALLAMRHRQRIGRRRGVMLLLGYAGFLAWQAAVASGG